MELTFVFHDISSHVKVRAKRENGTSYLVIAAFFFSSFQQLDTMVFIVDNWVIWIGTPNTFMIVIC